MQSEDSVSSLDPAIGTECFFADFSFYVGKTDHTSNFFNVIDKDKEENNFKDELSR
jgi:hypothetical protein